MDFAYLAETLGEDNLAALGALAIGFGFGAFAQKSRFCLRAAVIDFARGAISSRVAVWLLVFATALLVTQILDLAGLARTGEARQLASPQSLAGAAIGGLMFGTGMILARGCSSRLLVLSATGNLRALLSGLVFAVVAQASLHGFLAPLRNAVAAWASTDLTGGNGILAFLDMGTPAAIAFSSVWLAAGLFYAWRGGAALAVLVAALLTGLTIPAAWWFTSALSEVAFDPVQVESLTFTGPSADTLMFFLSATPVDFDIGLVPGVFLGAFVAAALSGELKLQGWHDGQSMRRYIAGAALMGFGGMLAGGCAVGAGITGGSIFALTAWITLGAMWLAAGITDRLLDYAAETDGASGGETASARTFV